MPNHLKGRRAAAVFSHIDSTAAVELQNRVIPAVAAGPPYSANPYVLQAAGVAV